MPNVKAQMPNEIEIQVSQFLEFWVLTFGILVERRAS